MSQLKQLLHTVIFNTATLFVCFVLLLVGDESSQDSLRHYTSGVNCLIHIAPREVVFIDANVSNWQFLRDSIPPQIEVVVFDANTDGLAQMAMWAQNRAGYDAIHLFSHGSVGTLQLGDFSLNQHTINARAEELADIGAALNKSGDLLLYSCDVAAGQTGSTFVSRLAQLTGADIAASNNLTGNSQLGGDWLLETHFGLIKNKMLAVNGYLHILAAPTIVSTPMTTIGHQAVYSYAPKATDADNQLLTWSVKSGTTLPTWLTLTDTMVVSTLAGQAPTTNIETSAAARGNGAFVDGTGSDARFKLPYGFTIDDQGNLFVADWENDAIRKVTPEGVVTTFATGFGEPKDVAIGPDGMLYVADTGTDVIYKLDSTGNKTVYAGVSGLSGSTEGTRLAAKFNNPNSLVFYTDSGTTYLYIADRNNGKVRVLNMATDTVSTLISDFDEPTGVSVDSRGDVFVAERGNGTETTPGTGWIKKITMTSRISGTVSTIATLNESNPYDVMIDNFDNVYVAGWNANKIFKLTPNFNRTVYTLSILVGSTAGPLNDGLNSTFSRPIGLGTDQNGYVYVADHYNNTIRKIEFGYRLTGTPTAPGVYPVSLTVSDGDNEIDHLFTIIVPDLPVFQSAATNTDGTKVILTYDVALNAATAATSAFTVNVNVNNNAVTAVAVIGSTIELTLTTAIANAQTITVAYTDPTTGNDMSAIQNTVGGDAMSFTAINVTNNVPDTTPPVFDVTPVTSNVGGTSLTLAASLNESGKIYYLIVADGETAPTAAEVKAGANYGSVIKITSGNSATSGGNFDVTFNITSLTASTAYDSYVVAEDNETTPNVMATVIKIDVTTTAFVDIDAINAISIIELAARGNSFFYEVLKNADASELSRLTLDRKNLFAFGLTEIQFLELNDRIQGMYTNAERLLNMANLPLDQINTQLMVLLLGALNALSGAEIATLGSVRLVELINTVNLDFSLVPDDKVVDILINLPVAVIPQLQSAVTAGIFDALDDAHLVALPLIVKNNLIFIFSETDFLTRNDRIQGMYTNAERLLNMANLPLDQINTQLMVLLMGALNALSGAEIATLGSVRLVELINTVNLDFNLVPDDKVVDILINLPVAVIPQLQSAVATRIINALSAASLATLPENLRVALVQASKLATVTTLTSVPNPSIYGSSVTFTAIVSPGAATGTVDFKDNGNNLTGCNSQPLNSGAATCVTASLSVGAHTIAATYSGDSQHLISTGNQTQTVSSGYTPPPPPDPAPITPPITPPVIEVPIVTPPVIELPIIEAPINSDTDNDGQDDAIEAGRDNDNDGIPDNLDPNDDNDGIDSVIEAQVPPRPNENGDVVIGDGNGDGITDTLQPNVTSLPFLHTDTAVTNPGNAPPVYVTLAATGLNNDGVKLTNVSQEDAPPDLPDDPAAPRLPLGLIRFTSELPPEADSQNFELTVPAAIATNGYWKQTAGGGWANLASAEYGGSIVTDEHGTRLNFTIQDGGPFDNDGAINGTINDPGGPGYTGATGVIFLPRNNGLSIFERLKVYGQRGQEGVRLNRGMGTILDQNIDGIVLPKALDQYEWRQMGNSARITGTNLEATITVREGIGTEILSIEGLLYLRLLGTEMYLGDQLLNSTPQRFTAAVFNESLNTTIRAVDAEFFPNTQPNRVFLSANARFTAAEDGNFYGQKGYETVVIHNPINCTLDQNIERVELNDSLTAYSVQQQGNTLEIQRDDHDALIKIAINPSVNGTLLVFTDDNVFVRLYSGGQLFINEHSLVPNTWLRLETTVIDK